MAALLAQNKFLFDFGQERADGTYDLSSTDQSLVASIVQAGEFFGALAASFIGDFLGRRGSLQVAVGIVTIGAVLQMILVGSIPLLVVGRFVLGAGVGVVSNCVPLYLSEIPPAALRGAVVSCWQLFLAIGQVSNPHSLANPR